MSRQSPQEGCHRKLISKHARCNDEKLTVVVPKVWELRGIIKRLAWVILH